MAEGTINVDYLIIGGGAVGMAFADSLLTEGTATMAIVDRHHRPGGHWNDAYPFVRLHQPSSSYGVSSRPLGSGMKDEVGHNRGMFELASGQEVLSHFDLVMQQQFLPTGRVHYFPMSDASEDGTVTSLLSGTTTKISARKVVDATHSKMNVPSTHTPGFTVSPGVAFIPLNELPRIAHAHNSYVVIGAGKTGMDAIIWLLDNGASPDQICWIMPRDAWLLPRENFQPGREFFPTNVRGIANQVEAIDGAATVDEVFDRLESSGAVVRIDPAVKPEAYHCAVVSAGELELLRRITNIVRRGRVTSITTDQVVLESGVIPIGPSTLFVDCSAAGIPTLPAKPVFAGNRITLQWIRFCQPTFSASLIGVVEANFTDEAEKNVICRPIAPPTVPRDWLAMMVVELANRQCWPTYPVIASFLERSRLAGGFHQNLTLLTPDDTGIWESLRRYLACVAPAAANARRLIED